MTADYGTKMVITVKPLEPATYQVDLTFLEWVYTTANQRPISVTINDLPMLKGFDVFSSAGGSLKPVKRSILIPVVNGQIVLVLTNDLDSPLLTTRRNAILSELVVTLQ